jgi:hypothetical protein
MKSRRAGSLLQETHAFSMGLTTWLENIWGLWMISVWMGKGIQKWAGIMYYDKERGRWQKRRKRWLENKKKKSKIKCERQRDRNKKWFSNCSSLGISFCAKGEAKNTEEYRPMSNERMFQQDLEKYVVEN